MQIYLVMISYVGRGVKRQGGEAMEEGNIRARRLRVGRRVIWGRLLVQADRGSRRGAVTLNLRGRRAACGGVLLRRSQHTTVTVTVTVTSFWILRASPSCSSYVVVRACPRPHCHITVVSAFYRRTGEVTLAVECGREAILVISFSQGSLRGPFASRHITEPARVDDALDDLNRKTSPRNARHHACKCKEANCGAEDRNDGCGGSGVNYRSLTCCDPSWSVVSRANTMAEPAA